MKKAVLWFIFVLLLLAAAQPAWAEEAHAQTPISNLQTNRADNIYRAAWAISRSVVEAGESFSFNETIGPRTEEHGYMRAPNGRGAEVVGGGVAQTASTLYLALLELDPPVRFDALEFYGEQFVGDYVPAGDLAVLVDYAAGRDFAFTNTTGHTLIIEMWLAEDALHCAVFSAEEATAGSMAVDTLSPFGSRLAVPTAGTHQAALAAEVTILCEEDAALLNNIALAADSITDTILLGGDVFSFNDLVGPRKAEFGYLPALNGRGVEVVGGGVAHVASAVWLAVKELPEVTVVEKSTYGKQYNQHYVDNSSDAILTDYNAGTDFSFRYTGKGSLTVYVSLEENLLHCEIYRTE